MAIASAAYTAYKAFEYYDAISNASNYIKNARDQTENQYQTVKDSYNGARIPDNYNENAANDAVQQAVKSSANAAMKGANLPGTSASGPLTTKCPR